MGITFNSLLKKKSVFRECVWFSLQPASLSRGEWSRRGERGKRKGAFVYHQKLIFPVDERQKGNKGKMHLAPPPHPTELVIVTALNSRLSEERGQIASEETPEASLLAHYQWCRVCVRARGGGCVCVCVGGGYRNSSLALC
jgi:hypothetical protein